MFNKKLLYITEEQKIDLERVKTQVKENGGTVSVMRLMQDSIQIFLDYYQEDAIRKYSPIYKK
jgi:hypothetical protein